MTTITLDNIKETFTHLDASTAARIFALITDPATEPDRAAIDTLYRSYRPHSDVEYRLLEVDTLLESHGIESIEAYIDGPTLISYCNMGDPYTPTVMYHHIDSRFLVASWADIVEELERANEYTEVDCPDFYAPIGTVSHDTLRLEDLIPTFMEVLDELNEQRSLHATREAFKDEYQRLTNFLGDIERRLRLPGYYNSEASSFDLNELMAELNVFSPLCAYFGTHPGDGEDFGFWPIIEDPHDDVIRICDSSNIKEPGIYYQISDHGNVTCLIATIDIDGNHVFYEAWSIV